MARLPERHRVGCGAARRQVGLARGVFLIVTISSMVAPLGCSPGRTAFALGSVGQAWGNVPGSDGYSLGSDDFYVCNEVRHGASEGTVYYVVVSGEGRVIAMASHTICPPGGVANRLFIDGRAVRELAELEDAERERENVLYGDAKSSLDDRKSRWSQLPKPPMRCPSGASPASWTALSELLHGWPFAWYGGRPSVTEDGTHVEWEAFLRKIKNGDVVKGIVTIQGP